MMSGGWVLVVWLTVICSPGVITYLPDTPASSNLAVVPSSASYGAESSKGTGNETSTSVSAEHEESSAPGDSLGTQKTSMSDSPSEPLPTDVVDSDDEDTLAAALPPSTSKIPVDNIVSNTEESTNTLAPSSPPFLTLSVPATNTSLPTTTTSLSKDYVSEDNLSLTNDSLMSSLPPFIMDTETSPLLSDNERNYTPATTVVSTTIFTPSHSNPETTPSTTLESNASDIQIASSTQLPIRISPDPLVNFVESSSSSYPDMNTADASSSKFPAMTTNATLPTVRPTDNTRIGTSVPSTTHNTIPHAKEKMNAKEAYLPPTVTYGSTISPHHVYSKLTPAPESIPPQPSPYNWYLLILNGNCSSVMRRERRFEVYVRANLAEKVSVEFSDVLVTSVTCNTVLFVNVTVFGENQDCINRTIFDLADSHALLVEFSGQMYNLTTVRTKTSMFGRKHYQPVQNYQNVSIEVMIYLAIGAVCLFIILSALLIALMLCCKKSKKAKRDYSKPNSPWYVQIENYNMTKIPRPNSVYSDASRSRTPRPNLFSAQKPSRYSDSSSTPLANDDSALMARDDNRSSTITNRSSLTVGPNQDDYSLLPHQPSIPATHRPKKSVEFAPIDDHTVPSDKMTPLSNQDKWGSLDGYDNFSYASL